MTLQQAMLASASQEISEKGVVTDRDNIMALVRGGAENTLQAIYSKGKSKSELIDDIIKKQKVIAEIEQYKFVLEQNNSLKLLKAKCLIKVMDGEAKEKEAKKNLEGKNKELNDKELYIAMKVQMSRKAVKEEGKAKINLEVKESEMAKDEKSQKKQATKFIENLRERGEYTSKQINEAQENLRKATEIREKAVKDFKSINNNIDPIPLIEKIIVKEQELAAYEAKITKTNQTAEEIMKEIKIEAKERYKAISEENYKLLTQVEKKQNEKNEGKKRIALEKGRKIDDLDNMKNIRIDIERGINECLKPGNILLEKYKKALKDVKDHEIKAKEQLIDFLSSAFNSEKN